MVRSAYLYHLAKEASRFGVRTGSVAVDWAEVIVRKDQLLRQLECEEEAALGQHGVSVLHGRASLVSAHELTLGDRRVQAEKVILATGSRPARPRVPGIEMAGTSDEALEMRELPESVVIIGGGVIAMEFAHLWNTVGVKVTVLEMGERILSSMDSEVAMELACLSESRGIEIVTRARVEQLFPAEGGLTVRALVPEGTREFRGARVMLAVGRVANTEGIGLETAGVQLRRGRVAVNEYLQTTAPNVYAGGDLVGGYCLAPVAAYEGRLAARNALRGNREKMDYSLVTLTVFTRPPVSSIGLTEAQARAKGMDVEVGRLPYADLESAAVEGETEGLIKVVADGRSGQILGAHIVGARSEELIHQFATAMKGKLTCQDLAGIIPIHPSFSEGVIATVLEMSRAGRRAEMPGSTPPDRAA